MSGSLDQGKAYVEKMRAKGKSEVEIRRALQQAGWDEGQIRLLLPPPEDDTR
ncbi:MAG: hypothetical protein HPY69_20265, partial [Armatimonadetes bacterium]|nr:hypothetical protein [Armatimonadota bacterium]